jgi:hypothetical protein
MSTASEKQVKYAMLLLDRAGYSTRYMDSKFKALGATMRQRSGTVEDWVRNLGVAGVSRLIDTLRAKVSQ